MKGINTKTEKSFLCNRRKLIGLDIKDGKKPTRSIPSLRVQSRWTNQGTLAPDFSWWEKQKTPILHQLPSQLIPRILCLFLWEQPKDRGTKYQALEMICLCSLQGTFKVPLQTHDILMEYAECTESSPSYRWGKWREQVCGFSHWMRDGVKLEPRMPSPGPCFHRACLEGAVLSGGPGHSLW